VAPWGLEEDGDVEDAEPATDALPGCCQGSSRATTEFLWTEFLWTEFLTTEFLTEFLIEFLASSRGCRRPGVTGSWGESRRRSGEMQTESSGEDEESLRSVRSRSIVDRVQARTEPPPGFLIYESGE